MVGCHDGGVAAPSARLARKIRESFPPGRVDEVISRLTTLPDTSQSAERIQTAMIVRSDGNLERFMSEVELVQLDRRDTLMGSGLEHADYEEQLDHLLGRVQPGRWYRAFLYLLTAWRLARHTPSELWCASSRPRRAA